MVLYKCSRCHKDFYKISHYKRHINRKNKCKEISSEELKKISNLDDNDKCAKNSTGVPKVAREVIKCCYCNRRYVQ